MYKYKYVYLLKLCVKIFLVLSKIEAYIEKKGLG